MLKKMQLQNENEECKKHKIMYVYVFFFLNYLRHKIIIGFLLALIPDMYGHSQYNKMKYEKQRKKIKRKCVNTIAFCWFTLT